MGMRMGMTMPMSTTMRTRMTIRTPTCRNMRTATTTTMVTVILME